MLAFSSLIEYEIQPNKIQIQSMIMPYNIISSEAKRNKYISLKSFTKKLSLYVSFLITDKISKTKKESIISTLTLTAKRLAQKPSVTNIFH